jgi:hypothetical protein
MYGVEVVCCECGITFEVPKEWEEQKRRTHSGFYCPNGHSLAFKGENAEEKLRRERDRLKQDQARLEEELVEARRQVDLASKRAMKAEERRTKLQKRVAAGVCPCCHRTVRQMALHIKRQHPQFIAEEATNVVSIKAVK